jgi:hypothetical protein
MASTAEAGMSAGSNLVSGAGAAVATFTLPASPLYRVESVVAHVDNTAGGDTTATLTYADTNGEVIAKRPQGEVIPAGDTGTATFALRLTGAKRRRFGGGGLGEYGSIGQVVQSGVAYTAPWTFFGGTPLLNVSPGFEYAPRVLYPGVYTVVAAVRAETADAGKQAFITMDFNSSTLRDGFASQFYALDACGAAGPNAFATVTIGKQMAVNDSIDVILGHLVGADRTFSVFITVQRQELP